MIETALAETDEVVIVIYDAPETTPVPLAVRSAWLRALYPSARVVEAWDGPTAVGYTPELMRAHERYLIDDLGIAGITHFYASEPYGAHISAALGAIDRRVDEARTRVPISATQIRADPYRYREHLHPLVYRDLIANIALLGAPGTGKTTLAQRLAEEFGTRWMPEYGREYWQAHQVNRRLSPAQLVEIAEGHLAREEALLPLCNRYLFTDTNALTTLTFARQYHGTVPDRLTALADQAAVRHDLTFVCGDEIPYEDTWDRSGEARRAAFQRQVIADLAQRKVPFLILRGDVAQRVQTVRDVLARFHKYMNVADLLRGEPR